MKLNIITNESQVLDGWANIGVANLNDISPAECSEIQTNDTCNMMTRDNVFGYLGVVIDKLAHKGRICIQSVNAYEVARLTGIGALSTEQFCNLVYGKGYQCALSYDEISEFLKMRGIQIYSVVMEDNQILVVGERP